MRILMGIFVLALAGMALAEPLDAVITGERGGGTLTGDDLLGVFNCKPPEEESVELDIVITPVYQCSPSLEVKYHYYDFYTEQFVDAGRLCYVPGGKSCTATIPIRLGGRGTGEFSAQLLKLTGECSGVDYEKIFTMTLSHEPTDYELQVLAKKSTAESALSAAKLAKSNCGQCCDTPEINGLIEKAENEIADSEDYLKQCDLTTALGKAAGAKNTADDAIDEITVAELGCDLVPVNDTPQIQNTTCANACDPNEYQEPWPDCTCIPRQGPDPFSGNASGNQSTLNVTGDAEPPGKVCGIFLVLFPLLAFAVTRR